MKKLFAILMSFATISANAQFTAGQVLSAGALNGALAVPTITGGTINGASIGNVHPGTGAFTNLTVTGDLSATGSALFTSVGAGVSSAAAPLDIETAGAVGGSSANSTLARLYAGSSTSPVTAVTPTVGISRYEAINMIDTEGGQNPALYVQTTGNNTSGGSTIAQAAGITANAQQIGGGDVVAVYGTATQAGTLSGRWAYGGFFNANANAAGMNAYAVETFQFNNTGSDAPLTLGGIPSIVGLHVGAGGANLNTAGAWFGNNGGGTQFDAGLYFSPGSIKSNTFVDDSSAANSILVEGSHNIGLNLSAGTFSSYSIVAPSFLVSPTGAVSASSLALTTALPMTSGGTGATTASAARSNLGAAAGGANNDITSLSGLTTALSVAQGGTGSTTTAGARSNLGAAASGANTDITSLNSPAIGSGTATTQASTDSSTRVATTAFAQSLLPAAYTSYTPTLTAASGSYTSASATGAYSQTGKLVCFRAKITITTVGTGTNPVFTLPTNVASTNGDLIVFAGRENAVTGKMVQGFTTATGNNQVEIYNYDNTSPAASGATIFINGCYVSS